MRKYPAKGRLADRGADRSDASAYSTHWRPSRPKDYEPETKTQTSLATGPVGDDAAAEANPITTDAAGFAAPGRRHGRLRPLHRPPSASQRALS